jgi:uncharacterized surface protein with fasciclin (FAS1) repeats
MNVRRRVLAVAVAAGVALAPAAIGASSANAEAGTKSLASVLLKDTTKQGNPSYDHNSADFDILTAAVLTVLAKKPNSPVSVLTDGSVKLTAFLPTDAAFERTGKALGITAHSEERLAMKYVKALKVKGVESVLLYHVIPGVKINAGTAAESDGAKLETALGQKVAVNVSDKGIFLRDKARDVRNAKVIVTNINKGNKQIAHAINGVLLPRL